MPVPTLHLKLAVIMETLVASLKSIVAVKSSCHHLALLGIPNAFAVQLATFVSQLRLQLAVLPIGFLHTIIAGGKNQ